MEVDYICHILSQKLITLLALFSGFVGFLALGDVSAGAGDVDRISFLIQYWIGDGLDPHKRSIYHPNSVFYDIFFLAVYYSFKKRFDECNIFRLNQSIERRPTDQVDGIISGLLDGWRYIDKTEIFICGIEMDNIRHILRQKMIALFALPQGLFRLSDASDLPAYRLNLNQRSGLIEYAPAGP